MTAPPFSGTPGTVPVAYIAGMTRSGSTLLGVLLAGRPDVRSLGEVWRIWDNGVVGGGYCSCGQVFGECPYWQQVVARDPEIFTTAVGRDMGDAARRIFTARSEIAYWTRSGRRKLLATLPDHFFDTLRRFYRVMLAQTGAAVLVDFTKNPVFGHMLVEAGAVDMAVIHLVRDPRAVAFSLGRVRRYEWKPGDVRELRRYSPARASAVWMLRNRSAHRLLRESGRPGMRVRYEDLVADPAAELARIGGFLGRDLPLQDDLARIERHIMGGNPTFRFASADANRVRADEAWVGQMDGKAKALVTALTAPLLLRYRYPLRRRPARPAAVVEGT